MFKEFKPVSKAQWIEKATSDLKGEDVISKYGWSLEDNLTVDPYYAKEDLIGLDYLKSI